MTSTTGLRAGILIISETASRDASSDSTAPILKDVFANDGAGKWSLDDIETKIVPDDFAAIQEAIKHWSDESGTDQRNVIITSGGTGFTPKDLTPEAIQPLLHKEAPGLVHGMISESLKVTPFAMMSRPVAGVRNKTLILTLPGSPKGAKENLQAVIKQLPHACLQAAGEDSRTAHRGGVSKLEKEAGINTGAVVSQAASTNRSHNHNHDHSHHHHHSHSHRDGSHQIPRAHTKPSDRPPQSNDPRLGASHRARQSPYPMLEVPEAVNLVLAHTPSPSTTTAKCSQNIAGHVISKDIHALESVPAYRASIVDGYAVIVPQGEADRSAIKGTFPVASVSHAQASSMPPPLQSGNIARITTGAPLPDGANAVVMVEDTIVKSMSEDTTEEKEVEILTDALVSGENIREPGSDIKKGSLILRQGDRISGLGGEIGVLAASGVQDVPIYRRPRVGVLSTGDEVTDISHIGNLSGGMIRDSNRPSLLTLIKSWNLASEVIDLGIARDTPEGELERAMRDAMKISNCDVIVTTGGVSMGELDLLKPTIERSLGGTIHFGRVNMKPGKPTTFATVPVKSTDSSEGPQTKLIFALPGNPASALVTANLFVLPCLQKMTGLPEHKCIGLEKITVWLADKVRCDKSRPEYHRVVVSMEKDTGSIVASSTGMQRSSRVGSLGGANGLLVLPVKEGTINAWESCDCLLLGGLIGFT